MSLVKTGVQRVERRAALAVWVLHHRLALSSTLGRLGRNPLGTALVALTLGVALTLPALLWMAASTLGDLVERWDPQVRLNVFVDASNEGVQKVIQERLRSNKEVAHISWQDAQTSLAEFVAAVGFEDADRATLAILGDAPLPAVAIVTPTPEVRAPARIRALAARLEQLPQVIGVQVDRVWVERLTASWQVARYLTAGLGALLGLGVLLAVGGLTRVTLDTRHQEIRVLRLVGATDDFVRRPFLYTGALQGLFGGLIACLLVMVLLVLVAGPLGELADSYQLGGTSALPYTLVLGSLLPGGALLGWMGARLGLALYLVAVDVHA